MYSIKKTAEKFGWVLAEVVIAGVIAVYADNTYFLAVAPFLEAIRNYIKHRND